MASLGAFGRRKARAELTFEFFDGTYRINPGFGQLHFVDFMESAADVDEDSPSALPLLKSLFRECLHAEDFDAFWRVALDEGQEVPDLLEIVYAVVDKVMQRPTSRPSDSSGGPSSTSERSAGDSSTQVIARLEQQGRPDLALLVTEQMKASA